MIMRDYLALDRTILANRRTLLSYLRTSIGLIAGGVEMVKLLTDAVTNIIGYAFIIASIPILIVGLIEFFKMRRALTSIVKSEEKKMCDDKNDIQS